MCGLFGYITRSGGGPNLARLRRIAAVTETRGRHAFGLAWLDSAGKIHTFKRPGAATEGLDDLERCRDARIVLGHCRYATHGDPLDNRNNHPHPAGDGWLVHNGVVRNYQHLIDAHDLRMRTECDSEVLGLMIAKSAGPVSARTARTVAQAEGNLALLGLWRDRMVLARRGNPLHFGSTPNGFYFGSLADNLPGNVRQVMDGTVSVLTLGRDGLRLEGRRINV